MVVKDLYLSNANFIRYGEGSEIRDLFESKSYLDLIGFLSLIFSNNYEQKAAENIKEVQTKDHCILLPFEPKLNNPSFISACP